MTVKHDTQDMVEQVPTIISLEVISMAYSHCANAVLAHIILDDLVVPNLIDTGYRIQEVMVKDLFFNEK